MILQICSHLWAVDQRLYSHAAQLIGIANARQHKQLRRLNCARAQDHSARCFQLALGSALAIADAGCTLALEKHFGRLRVGEYAQIGPAPGRFEVGLSGARAPAAMRGELIITDAFLVLPVEIVGARNPKRLAEAITASMSSFLEPMLDTWRGPDAPCDWPSPKAVVVFKFQEIARTSLNPSRDCRGCAIGRNPLADREWR